MSRRVFPERLAGGRKTHSEHMESIVPWSGIKWERQQGSQEPALTSCPMVPPPPVPWWTVIPLNSEKNKTKPNRKKPTIKMTKTKAFFLQVAFVIGRVTSTTVFEMATTVTRTSDLWGTHTWEARLAHVTEGLLIKFGGVPTTHAAESPAWCPQRRKLS